MVGRTLLLYIILDSAVVFGVSFMRNTCSDLGFLLSPRCSSEQFLSPFKMLLEDHTGCFGGLLNRSHIKRHF